MAHTQSDADFLLKAGDFAESAGAALAMARQIAEEIATEQIKQAEVIPEVLKSLRDAGYVPDSEIDEVREKLASHSGALRIIGRLADLSRRRKEAQTQAPPRIGSGVDVDPNARETPHEIQRGRVLDRYDIRPSDRPLLELIGR